jgi:hypothetical protein
MKRAIVSAVVAIFVASILGCGQGSGSRRPVPETKRDPPSKVEGSALEAGTQPQPASAPPADE